MDGPACETAPVDDDGGRTRRPGRAGGARHAGGLGVGVLLLAGVALALQGVGWDLGSLVRPRVLVEVDGVAVAVPPPAPATGRVLPAVPVTTTGSHAFLHVDEVGAPVGYDPCRPVGYVVRSAGAPADGAALVAEAMAVVSAATGLALVPVGATDEAPDADRRLLQPERYGPGWAPVLVAWADETEVPELAGPVAGVGGSAAVPGADGQGRWLAAGRLVLDAPDLAALRARPDGEAQARGVLVHEIAHVLGLDHVEDAGELMHPLTRDRTGLGPGDRQGLALVGAVACQP